MHYQKGLHLIATLAVHDSESITSFHGVQHVLQTVINDLALQQLGEVYHQFEPGGYTAVICLSESHISIHTWPEFNKVNLDIYLSNYQQVNDSKVEKIFETLVAFYHADITEKTTLYR